MTALLAILTVLTLILLDVLRRRMKGTREVRTESPAATPAYIWYLHPGHCWALIGNEIPVKIGTDDFTQRLMGPLDEVTLPEIGSVIHQGDPIVTLRHGARTLTQIAPIGGRVNLVNTKLAGHPERVNRSPYGKGWLVEINPFRLATEIHSMMTGAAARRWQASVDSRLASRCMPELGTLLQDGGTLIDNIGDRLSDAEWNRIVSEFYPATTHIEHHQGEQS